MRVLDHYMAELEAGRPVDTQQMVAEHPLIAAQLEACLAGINFIHRANKPADALPQLGDFRIIREIGRGGMGVVYEAEQISLRRRVALKVLRFGAAGDPEAMQRFEQEARTVAHLHHTNIVPIFAVGCEQGVHYYAMQYIEGRSLAAVAQASVSSQQPLESLDVARWGFEAAEALAHAHLRGVIHRDVKPSNLLLDADGRIWLTDFGLARRLDEVTLTVTGALLGTPRYMSPEQATAVQHPVDHRTDIYSLGATLYELATGQPVFDGETPHVLLSQIVNTEPVAPRRVRAELPRDLETIILKCLAKETSRRYASAAEMADDLRSLAQGRAIRARRPSLAERVARWSVKQRRSALVAVATLLVAVMATAAGTLGMAVYRDSLHGKLMLTTNATRLVAHVSAADNDSPAMPPFSLPTQRPQELTEGEYHVQIAGPGHFSETYQSTIERSIERRVQVTLGQRDLLTPIEAPTTFDLIPAADHADVLVRTFNGARRFDGRSGAKLWDTSFPGDQLDDKTGFIWQAYRIEGWEARDGRQQLVATHLDLNNDGVNDLVWASQRQAALLAISGKDGKPLWLFHDRGAKQPDINLSEGKLLGQPATIDVDDDGTLDFIASIVIRRDDLPIERATFDRAIIAVLGKSGKEVWRHKLANAAWSRESAVVPHSARWYPTDSATMQTIAHPDDSIYAYPWMERTNPWSEVPSAPQVVHVDNQPRAIVTAAGKLLQLDVTSGTLIAEQSIDARPVRPPQVLTSQGSPSLLLCYQPAWEAFELVAWSLQDAKPIWQTTVPGARWGYGANELPPDWPKLVDLDRNGTPEIALPTGGFIGSDDSSRHRTSRRWSGVTVIESETGRARAGWPQVIVRTAPDAYPLLAPLQSIDEGPDLDGDGVRELFTVVGARGAKRAEAPSPFQSCIQIDARSGINGRVLWWQQLLMDPSVDASQVRCGPLRWGAIAADGHPQLLVNYIPDYDSSRRDTLYCLAAGSGQLLHEGDDLRDPRIADLNGDGLLDIACMQPERSHYETQGKVRTFRGSCPDHWRRFGELREATDLDGDGMNDLHTPATRLSAVSARDGRMLWQLDKSLAYCDQVKFLQSPLGDIDRDGVGDVLLMDLLRGFSGASAESNDKFAPVHLMSGRTGKLLWRSDLKVHVNSFGDMNVFDLDGDGAGEFVLVIAADVDVERPAGSTYSSHDWRLWVVVLEGRDGRVRWKQPLRELDQLMKSLPVDNAPPVPAAADLNADGVLDLVIGSDSRNSATTAEVRAFDGRNGELLWRREVRDRSTQIHLTREFPQPVVADLDHDGQPEVVMLETVAMAGEKTPQDQVLGRDEVTTLDGRTGEVRWRWRGDYPSLAAGLDWAAEAWRYRPAPLIVKLAGDGKSAVCIWNTYGAQVSLIGHDGKLRASRKVKLAGGQHLRVWPRDVDQDGHDELLFVDDDHVVVTRGDLATPLWKKRFASGVDINGVRNLPGVAAPTVVVEGVRFSNFGTPGTYQAYGLNGATGAVQWACDYPNLHSRRAYVDLPVLARATDKTPRVLFLDQDTVSIVRQSLPVTDDNRFTAKLDPAVIAPLVRDTRLEFQLPWCRLPDSVEQRRVFYLFQLGSTLAFAIMMTVWMARRRFTRALVTIGIAVACMLVVVAMTLFNDGPLAAGESYSWDRWYVALWFGMVSTIVLVVYLEVLYNAARFVGWLWRLGPERYWLASMRRLGRCYGGIRSHRR